MSYKNLYIKAIILFTSILLISNNVNSQCYQHESNYSGIEDFYDSSLNDIACDLSNVVASIIPGDNFKVYGYDLYPILYYTDENEGFAHSIDMILSNHSSVNENSLLFIKTISSDGNIEIHTELKLKNHSDFNLTSFEYDALKGLIQNICGDMTGIPETKLSEYQAMEELACILDSNCEIEDVLENSGFKLINLDNHSVSYNITGVSSEKPADNCYDLAGIQSSGKYIRNDAIAALKNDITGSAMIFTSDVYSGSGYTINEQTTKGHNYYESLPNFFVIWMHFTESGKVYYKTKVNVSESDCLARMELIYNSYLNGSGYATATDPDNNIITNYKSTCENPAICSLTKLDKWKAECCLGPYLDPIDPFGFQGGVVLGVLDGLMSTVFFIYDVSKGLQAVSEHTPFTLSWFGSAIRSCINEGSIYEGLKTKIDGDLDFFKSMIEFVPILFSSLPTMFSALWTNIKDWFDKLNPLSGKIWESGYAIGVVVFEVILTYLTGGSSIALSSANKLSKFTKAGLSTLKSIKSPGDVTKIVTTSLNKSYNSAKSIKCKILYGGCFIKDTPVLMAHNPFKNVAPAMALAAMPLVAPIQDVQVDDMVKAYHHEEMYLTASNNDDVYVPGWQDYDYLDITPETWQVGKFIITEDDGSVVEIEANRPNKWFEDQRLNEKGDRAFIHIEEMGIADYAVLQEIKPTDIDTRDYALNESGNVDRPVITTYKRIANEISDYTFSNGQVISCTPNHPFYSSDRQVYIPVGELILGETVQTAGEREVKFIGGKAREKGEHVYNFEVWREHNYYVGFDGKEEFVLVHNSCFNLVKNFLKKEGKLPDNYITKQQAKDLGWVPSQGNLNDVAPGKWIGGDKFGNYEGKLPSAPGRTWKEADINYQGGTRGPERLVYSNDGLYYKTTDHYGTFTKLD